MFNPLNCGHGRKRRTHYMLAPGGRVVRADHDPRTTNRLMVPTESELKAMLYDQTGVRAMTHVNQESIDYVALHANRSVRRGGSNSHVGRVPSSKFDGVGGYEIATETQRRWLSGSCKPWIASEHNPNGGTGCGHRWVGVKCLKTKQEAKRIRQRPLRPKVHAPEEFPEEDSGEEDISLFLHYFSAFGIASNGETTTAPVPSSPPRQTTDEQTRDIENVGVTEATLEMSKSLAQVDLYSILARVPPSELGRDPSGLDMGTKFNDRSITSKSWSRKRDRHSTHSKRGSVGRSERRVSDSEPKQEVGYVAKDPLGEEVAQMRAKIHVNSLRVKQEAEREQRSHGIDIEHHAALFARRSQTINAKRLASFTGDDRANANDKVPPSKTKDSTLAQEILGRCDELSPSRRLGRKRRGTKAMCIFRRGGRGAKLTPGKPKGKRVPESRSARGRESSKDTPSEAQNPHEEVNILHAEESMFDGENSGSPRRKVAGGGSVGRAPVERALGAVDRDGQANVDGVAEPGDGLPTDSYGQDSFESAEDVIEDEFVASPAGGSDRVVGAENGRSDAVHDYIEGGSRCAGYSYHQGAGAGGLSEENAAALKIETCWRGFLGRSDAKRALRSVLLCSLRKLGGGRVSKAMVLADLGESDQRELNRTLRTATQSRLPLRQLPSQIHFLDCVHFVERLQRRRAHILDTRRKKWIVERAKRRERGCTEAQWGRSRLSVTTIASN